MYILGLEYTFLSSYCPLRGSVLIYRSVAWMDSTVDDIGLRAGGHRVMNLSAYICYLLSVSSWRHRPAVTAASEEDALLVFLLEYARVLYVIYQRPAAESDSK